MAAVGGMTYPLTATASASSQVLAFSGPVMQRLMERHAALARNAMGLMVQRIGELQQRCVELATQRVEQRMARAIVRLAGQTGRRVAEGVLLDVALSRQDLAEMTGTTLFTVSRRLNQWQKAGGGKIARRRVTVAQLHQLTRRAEELSERP